MSACRGGNRERTQVTQAVLELDNLVKKKRKANLADKAGNRPHTRERGTLRIVTMLPKPTKNGPKIPRVGIDRQWLADNPDADVPSRIYEFGEGAAEDVAVVEPELAEGHEEWGWARQAELEEMELEKHLDEKALTAVEPEPEAEEEEEENWYDVQIKRTASM
jgi:hypothetical protein